MQWQLMHLDRFRRRVQTLSLHTMDPSVVDAVVHLDHNSGTKSRLWTAARGIVDVLCSRRPAGCGEKLRDALQTLRGSRVGVGGLARSAILRTAMRAACHDYEQSTPTHPPTIDFEASSSARALLGQEATDDIPGLLSGLPLHLTNCTDSPHLARWQQWRLTAESRNSDSKAKCFGLCLLHRFKLEAAPSQCLAMGKSRSPRQPYSSLAQLAPCVRVAPGKDVSLHKDPPAEVIRSRLNFNAESGLLQTTHKMRDIKGVQRLTQQTALPHATARGLAI